MLARGRLGHAPITQCLPDKGQWVRRYANCIATEQHRRKRTGLWFSSTIPLLTGLIKTLLCPPTSSPHHDPPESSESNMILNQFFYLPFLVSFFFCFLDQRQRTHLRHVWGIRIGWYRASLLIGSELSPQIPTSSIFLFLMRIRVMCTHRQTDTLTHSYINTQ